MTMTVLDDLLPLLGGLLKMAALLSVFSVAYSGIQIAVAEDDAHTYRLQLRRSLLATAVILTITTVVPWLASFFSASGQVNRIMDYISLW